MFCTIQCLINILQWGYLWGPRCSWKYNIKMELEEIGDNMELVQVVVCCWFLVAVLNFNVLIHWLHNIMQWQWFWVEYHNLTAVSWMLTFGLVRTFLYPGCFDRVFLCGSWSMVRRINPVCCVLWCSPSALWWHSRPQNEIQTAVSAVAAWRNGHPCWQNRRDMTHRNPVVRQPQQRRPGRCAPKAGPVPVGTEWECGGSQTVVPG